MDRKNNFHVGHRARLKQRFELEGLDSFEPHEVLEILLFYAVPKRDTNPVAHALLDKFGTLDRVFDAELSELLQVDGVGYNTALLIKLLPQTAQYYAKVRFERPTAMTNGEQLGEYMCSRIGFLPNEVFAAAAFDSARREIAFELISEGSLAQTDIRLHRLAEFAICNRAPILVIAHNHIYGRPIPSQSDINVTRRICRAMNEIGVKVVDHLIVTGERYFSFSINGIMPE